MFCPSCKCEFRPRFARCEGCNEDLVESLSDVKSRSPPAASETDPLPGVRMADYCGFVDLDEARQARDRLREDEIRSEITIREAPGSSRGPRVEEEYWLRIDVNAYKQAVALLDYDAVDASASESQSCAQCGHTVAEGESFCPGCGAPFEAD